MKLTDEIIDCLFGHAGFPEWWSALDDAERVAIENELDGVVRERARSAAAMLGAKGGAANKGKPKPKSAANGKLGGRPKRKSFTATTDDGSFEYGFIASEADFVGKMEPKFKPHFWAQHLGSGDQEIFGSKMEMENWIAEWRAVIRERNSAL